MKHIITSIIIALAATTGTAQAQPESGLVVQTLGQQQGVGWWVTFTGGAPAAECYQGKVYGGFDGGIGTAAQATLLRVKLANDTGAGIVGPALWADLTVMVDYTITTEQGITNVCSLTMLEIE